MYQYNKISIIKLSKLFQNTTSVFLIYGYSYIYNAVRYILFERERMDSRCVSRFTPHPFTGGSNSAACFFPSLRYCRMLARPRRSRDDFQ